MAYYRRRVCESDVYHVFARGTGRRVIFEDDVDRLEFISRTRSLAEECPGELYALCLMGNHFHLIAHMGIEHLSLFMKRLCCGFARYFNARHGRSGHLFEGRFGSEPIATDEQLLAAVRYVHRNPIAPGLSQTCDYPWSSYHEYLETPDIVKTERILGIAGGLSQFKTFHECDGGTDFIDIAEEGAECVRRLTQDEAVEVAKSLLGEPVFENLPGLPKDDRDEHLRQLWQAGMPIRQVSLITGVGRGIVQRAVKQSNMCRMP